MGEIVQRGLTVLPAHSGRLRRKLCLTGATLLLGVGMLLANGLAFEVRMNGSLELLFFGVRFLDAFLTRLPFDLLAAVLLLSGVAAWLIHYGRLARMALVWMVLITYGITGAGGMALAQSGLNEQVRGWATKEGRDWPMLGPFYRHRAHYRMRHAGFRMGQVVEVGQGTGRILTPNGEEVPIGLPPGLAPKVGDHVRLSGVESGGRFIADDGQLCDPRRMRRYFHHMRMGPAPMGGQEIDRPPGHMKRGPMMGPGMGKGRRHMGQGDDKSNPRSLKTRANR